MTNLGLDALNQWLTRIDKTIERLLKAERRGENVSRELAEYRKLLTQAQRMLADAAGGAR